jgi:LmbE family N-acetylglucosaminyl deacetylase
LGVFAHPDDESFGAGGTLARYARAGVVVHVCTVTDGAAGTVDPALLRSSGNDGGPVMPAQLRRAELACACAVLGAHLHTLAYRDSGMAGAPDNQHPASLFQAPLDAVVGDLVRIIRETRPHVVITHEQGCGYQHPDHVKVSQAVARAWAAAADSAACPELAAAGLTPWAPARLYHLVVPRRVIRRFIRRLQARGQDPCRFGVNGDIDLTGLGTPDRAVHVCLDVRAWLPVKLEASACHRSQGAGLHWPEFLGRWAMGFEHLVQVLPAGAQRHADLFEGVARWE